MTSSKSDNKYARMGAVWTVVGAIVGILAIVVTIILDNARDGGGPADTATPAPTATTSPLGPAQSAVPPQPAPSADPNMPEASGPRTVYLEDLDYTQDSNPYDNRDIAEINGQSHTRAQAAQFCFGDKERRWTYVLGRQYARFVGGVGLSDDSVSAARIRFEVFTDGKPAFSKDLEVGQFEMFEVPATGVLHVKLVTTLLTREGGCGAASGEWVDVRAEA